MIRISRFAARAIVVLACVLLPALAFAPDASAKTCAHVSIGGSAVGLTLTPSTVTIVAGGCVTYTNNTTPLSVQVTVGKASSTAAPGNAVTFAVATAGTYAVKAAQQPIGGSGSGTLVVKRAPAPKPTPTPTRSASPSTSRSPQPSPSQSTGPQVAPTPTLTPGGSHPSPSVSLAGPSLGPPPITQGITTPSPTPSTSPTVVASQLQPASGRAVGLPAAVAALLVVGGGAAFWRVLLAEPGSGDGTGRDRGGPHRR